MKYISTRSGETKTAEEALLQGLAKDGGLYLPDKLPEPFFDYEKIKNLSYPELASFILTPFLPEISEEELSVFTKTAYTGNFETDEVVPVRKINEDFSIAEMFHGKTCAFKDLALSLFPYLLDWAQKRQKKSKRILILTATSGDTGKAALEGFRDVPGIDIMVFYPSHGVSPLQKDQMQKQLGENVKVVGINGNFDDAQSMLKQIFAGSLRESSEEKGILFSSANSINIGRLLPQIVYYVWIWTKLVKDGAINKGESFNVVVPTGNFGNILAAYIAKRIGTPINQLVCASNENHVLADFFETGTYDIRRDFHLTESPSMDILISSNFERFLYYMTGSADKVNQWMHLLRTEKVYKVSSDELETALKNIRGGWTGSERMKRAIADVYQAYRYLMDPHTAVAYDVYKQICNRGGIEPHSHTVIIGTAHPYKFPGAIADALGLESKENPYDTLRMLEKETGIAVPKQLKSLETAEKRFPDIVERQDMEKVIKEYRDALIIAGTGM